MSWTREDLQRRSDEQISSISDAVLNKLTKWRLVFAGWQLGTRSKSDPESQAVRDIRELTILMRVELNALTAALIEAGLITSRAFTEYVILEAEELDRRFELRFPGMKSTESGIEYELPLAAETMKGWLP